MKTRRRRWLLLGGVFGTGVGAVVVSALALFAGPGIAAGQAKPVNTAPPSISGTPQEGKTLIGSRGEWNNNPTDYDFFWMRCDKNGGSCANISGAHARQYTLTSVDVGNTVRFRVVAKNADGNTSAASVPSAVIQKAATPVPPTPSRGGGCPTGSGNPDQVSAITSPANLLIDGQTSDPAVVPSGVQTLVVRYRSSMRPRRRSTSSRSRPRRPAAPMGGPSSDSSGSAASRSARGSSSLQCSSARASRGRACSPESRRGVSSRSASTSTNSDGDEGPLFRAAPRLTRNQRRETASVPD
jgi:hypothetical protein